MSAHPSVEKSTPHRLIRWLPWLEAAGAAGAAGLGFYARSGGFFLLALALLLAAVAAFLRRRPRAASALHAASLTLAGLALADWLTPYIMSQSGKSFVRSYQDGYRTELSDIGTDPNAGVFSASGRNADGELIYDVKYSVGPDHLRITPGNPPGPHRVNFFGCSFVYGEGLNDDQTLPYFYSQLASDVHVMNYGFHGRGAHQALAIMQSGRDTKGEVNFFLAVPFHAERSACRPVWTNHSPRYELQPDGSVKRNGSCGDSGDLPWYLLTRAAAYSNILASAENSIRGRKTDADFDLYVALIRSMATLSHERGQRFVVGFMKSWGKDFTNTSYTNETLRAALVPFSDEVIDLTLKDKPNDPARRTSIPFDGHPTAYANQERAKILAVKLRPYLK